ncbi:hypothetical protein ElyMa_000299500 [Elysia marginata]|uniref:Uncharacterized protein n=1 Tax=Elysia marginata TaxID=1093978 RepID=A0AAV4F8L1_9GAST|nr:hypothetical protein ElyMa_000299500 [Elysia marginata]
MNQLFDLTKLLQELHDKLYVYETPQSERCCRRLSKCFREDENGTLQRPLAGSTGTFTSARAALGSSRGCITSVCGRGLCLDDRITP